MGRSPEDPRFWEERGIDLDIKDVRPYIRYYADDVGEVQAAYDNLPNPGQKATATRKAKAKSGILIMRHPALPWLPEVFPEMRPDEAISTATPRRHWHGYGEPPEDGRHYELLNPDSRPGIAHRRKHHGGGNTEEVHEISSPGKYHFAPTGKMDVTYEHDHAEAYGGADLRFRSKYVRYLSKAERRARHLAKQHGGVDVEGPHTHTVRRPNPDENLARRLDLHPWAEALLDDATEVFFGIEGCLKADSILSAILRDGRKASVFSVPSVTLWDAEELPEFARLKLQGKRVVIVPDADWIDNPRVIEQARLCRTYLRRLGVDETYVAAPPLVNGEVEHKGVDDYLGSGGTLDGLAVQHRVVHPGLQRSWLREFGLRRDRFSRDAEVLHDLAAHVGRDGTFYGTLAKFAKVLGVGPKRVERAIRDLEELGAIRIDGALDIRQKWYLTGWGWGTSGEGWADNPVITLRPELRGEDLEPVPLG